MSDSYYQNTVYHVVYITDDNYAMPTAVSITSLYYNKKETSSYEYHVYVICDNVLPNNLSRLKALSKEGFKVTVIEENEHRLSGMTALGVEHVSSTALFKFDLPNIFSQYDKMLYLDGDTLVTKDLSELFETDIEGRYAAVVKDYNATQYKIPQLAKLGISHKHNFYWNSGMMLLNLKKLREDNVVEKLYDYRINGINYFMDQDALNVVFEENVVYVPIFYNTITSFLERYELNDIAEYYDIEPYNSYDEAIGQASVLHLAGQYKPWEHLVPILSGIYSNYHAKSPYNDISLQLLDNDKLEHHQTDDIIPIVYIIDNPNAKYAAVSISSLIHNKLPETKYDIMLICHNIDPTRIVRFQAISAENVKINIIRPDYSSENFSDQYDNIKKTSLISRIRLSEILPQYNKVIFLSPTTMVSKDLTDLYCQNIEGYAAGAVMDFRQQLKGFPKRIGIKHSNYYNTGVMLYNLKYFRDNDWLNVEMLHYIKYGMNVFEYQDAFNVCAGTKTLCLSYYFNALDNVFDMLNKPLDTANMLGVKRYSGLTELFSRAYIVNFSGNIKPWTDIYSVFSDTYLRYFLRSVFCDYSFNNILDKEVEKLRRDPEYIIASENNTQDIFYNKTVFNYTIPKGDYTEYVYKPSEEWSESSVYRKYGDVTSDGLNHQPREKKIIVSLTTIPFRIEAASLVIAIMMHQTMKPDEIIVNLGSELFKDIALPELLLAEEKCGVKINYCRDLFCHTKYFHTMQMYPDDIIITVDDDILYEETLIEDLYNSCVDHPDCISSMRAHLITFDKNNQIQSYIDWKYCCTDYIGIPSHKLLATGAGGVLYPPHILTAETFNADSLLEVCPKADDIWLKIMEIVSNAKVVVSKRTDPLTFIGETQNVGLFYSNIQNGKNDEQLHQTIKKYKVIDEANTIMSRLFDHDDEIEPFICGQHRSATLAQQFDSLTNKVKKAEKELKTAKNKVSEVEKELKTAKNKVSEVENELEDTRICASKAEKELDDMKRRVSKTEKELNDMRSRAIKAEKSLETATNHTTRIEKDLEDTKARMSKAEKDLETARKHTIKIEKDFDNMRKRAENAEQSLREIDKKFCDVSHKADGLQKEIGLIRMSFSFRIGRFITWLPRKIIGFFTHNKNR